MARLDQLLKILAAEPEDSFTLYALATEYAKLGDVPNAILYFDRCIAVDPKHCYAYYHKAKTLADADRVPEALPVLTAGIAQAKSISDGKALNELLALQDQLT